MYVTIKPISSFTPSRPVRALNRRARARASGAPKALKTTAAPRGSRAAIASGSGVRTGSVKNRIAGKGFHPAPARRKHEAAVRSRFQNPSEMTAALFDAAAARAAVLARISRAARGCGREPADVTLVAVSKQQPADRVAAMIAAGQAVFGENRVQEAMERWAPMREGKTLHLIGPLQTNKAREAVAFFDVIETLDRERLAAALAAEIARQGRSPRLHVQVNTGEEPQKAGVIPAQADAFIAACRVKYGLKLEGLMCIPPAQEPAGPHFALLAKIAARNGLPGLSMGMSEDFEAAVRFGATGVRVGSALFGARS